MVSPGGASNFPRDETGGRAIQCWLTFVRLPLLHLRQRSLIRGVGLALAAFAASLLLAGFPYIATLHGSRWQLFATLAAAWGMAETLRCVRRHWSFYHVGVLILLYSEMMILLLTVFLTFYP